MKKIFTLFAVAAMAMSAFAQGSYFMAEGDAPAAGTSITSVSNMKMTFGTGGDAFAAAVADENAAYFGATAYTKGNGINGNKENGTLYFFEPSVSTKLYVIGVFNSGKTPIVKLDSYSGDDVAFTALDGTTGATVAVNSDGQFDDKLYGALVLDVEAGKKYAVGLAGSKMGFYGFIFGASASDIENIQATEAQKNIMYNLLGQKVGKDFKGIVIKNGVKMIQK